MTEPFPDDAAARAYMAFAKRLVGDLQLWVVETGLENFSVPIVSFTEDAFALDSEDRIAVWRVVMDHYGDDVWGTPEATECARIHLRGGIVPPPQLSNSDGESILEPTFDQQGSFLVVTLLRPLVAAMERHHTVRCLINRSVTVTAQPVLLGLPQRPTISPSYLCFNSRQSLIGWRLVT